MELVAIINEAAGHGRCGKLAPAALDRLREGGLAVVELRTRGPGHATELVRDAVARGHRAFIAVGGDGTAFEVVNGLASQLGAAPAAERARLGFLPLGTGNSFLRDFGARAGAATDALLAGRSRPCDVVRLGHAGGALYFINLLSIGFVADVCSLANRRFKALGAAGYGLAVVANVATLGTRPLRMRLDGGPLWEQEVTFVSFSNSRFTGGTMMMAPYAEVADGLLDVVVCGKMGRYTLLETFPKIFSGTHVHHHGITTSRARVIELEEPEPVDLMIDGEVLRYKPERIEVVPRAFDVIV